MDLKKDLFSLIRHLGKPTMFLTKSANEIKCPDLLSTLHRINDLYKVITVQVAMVDLDPETQHSSKRRSRHLIYIFPQTFQHHHGYAADHVSPQSVRQVPRA
jgi:hypothetical protein